VVFHFLVLVVTTSAIDCLERPVSKVTYYVSSGTSNPTHSLNHCLSGYQRAAVYSRCLDKPVLAAVCICFTNPASWLP